MKITAPVLDKKTNLEFTPKLLQKLPCGLHRVTLDEAYKLLPELSNLYLNFPKEVLNDLIHEQDSWVIDIKIHMLMKGQYPCIPNWHCDNVPRDKDGKLMYGNITKDSKPMYLWLSDNPTTEFLSHNYNNFHNVKDHGDLDKNLKSKPCGIKTFKVPSNTWLKMWQNTPHRGTQAEDNTWRVFCRLTHKSLIDGFMARQQVHPIRRHAQVYLPCDLNW